jgi:hypothetical protein
VVVKGFAFGEWSTIVAIAAQLVIVSILYPWRRLRRA